LFPDVEVALETLWQDFRFAGIRDWKKEGLPTAPIKK
jgi:hypothetical protein